MLDGPLGFDVMDRKLRESRDPPRRRARSASDNIAAASGKTDTIGDVIRPYLIQQGFLQQHAAWASSPRWRRSA